MTHELKLRTRTTFIKLMNKKSTTCIMIYLANNTNTYEPVFDFLGVDSVLAVAAAPALGRVLAGQGRVSQQIQIPVVWDANRITQFSIHYIEQRE